MSERLSVSAFARASGCDEKQVRRAIDKGLLHKGDDGLLDDAQIEAGWRKPNRRTIVKMSEPAAEVVRESSDSSSVVRSVRAAPELSETEPVVRDGETPADAAERIVAAGGGMLPIAEAVERKENYLGLLKQIEYDQKAGAVVAIGDVGKLVADEYAKVRTRLLAIPSERAPALHRLKTVAEVEVAMRAAIVRALEELTGDGAAAVS